MVVVDDTTIANVGREAVRLPSLTFDADVRKRAGSARCSACRDSLPVVVLNVAQPGLLVMLNGERLALGVASPSA